MKVAGSLGGGGGGGAELQIILQILCSRACIISRCEPCDGINGRLWLTVQNTGNPADLSE